MNHKKSPVIAARVAAFAAVCVIPFSGALASGHHDDPPPPPKPKPDTAPLQYSLAHDAVHDDTNINHPANETVERAIARAVYRVLELAKTPTAGAPAKTYKEYKEPPAEECKYFCNPSFFLEYYHLDSDDNREADFDTRSNSVSGGFDFTTVGDLLVGMIYSYTRGETISEFFRTNTRTNAHFVNLYVAKSVTNFLSVGVTGGYGNTDATTRIWNSGSSDASDSDSWTTSPFVTLSYAHDAFSTSFTTSYLYSHTGSKDTGKINFTLTAAYDVSEWLTLEVKGKATQILHDEGEQLGQDDHWFGVGTKVTAHLNDKLSVYAAYDFEFNQDYQDHTVTGGLSYSF